MCYVGGSYRITAPGPRGIEAGWLRGFGWLRAVLALGAAMLALGACAAADGSIEATTTVIEDPEAPPEIVLPHLHARMVDQEMVFARIRLDSQPVASELSNGWIHADHDGTVVDVLWAPPGKDDLVANASELDRFTVKHRPERFDGEFPDLALLTLIDPDGVVRLMAFEDRAFSNDGGRLFAIIEAVQDDPLPVFESAYTCDAAPSSIRPEGVTPIDWFVEFLVAYDGIADLEASMRGIEQRSERIADSHTWYDPFADDDLLADSTHIAWQLAAGVDADRVEIRRTAPVYVDASEYRSDDFVLYALGTDGEYLGWATIGQDDDIFEYVMPLPRAGANLALITSNIVYDTACHDWAAISEYQIVIPRDMLTGEHRPLVDAADWTVDPVDLPTLRALRAKSVPA